VAGDAFGDAFGSWDLESGRALATLEGHASGVNACAVTPDGRRVVSASADKTLKVWDLETYACLFTHRGDAPYVAVAAGMAGIVAGDSAGGVWFLDWPPTDLRATQFGAGDHENRPHESRRAQETSSSRPTMKKHTILFLAANPTGTSQLALGEEAGAIQVELERSGYRDCFELETRWDPRRRVSRGLQDRASLSYPPVVSGLLETPHESTPVFLSPYSAIDRRWLPPFHDAHRV